MIVNWLLNNEKTCRKSATSGNSCSGGDEIVTQYQYDPKNLFRIGMAVTADGRTLRTCYQYDKYGNQIGVTEPRADLSTCPAL